MEPSKIICHSANLRREGKEDGNVRAGTNGADQLVSSQGG